MSKSSLIEELKTGRFRCPEGKVLKVWYTVVDVYPQDAAELLAHHKELTEEGEAYGPLQFRYCDREAAIACAEDYHTHHGGWEAAWPLSIALRIDAKGKIVALFEVERQAVPHFVATELASIRKGYLACSTPELY